MFVPCTRMYVLVGTCIGVGIGTYVCMGVSIILLLLLHQFSLNYFRLILHSYTHCRCTHILYIFVVHFLGAPPDRLILQQNSSRSRCLCRSQSAINVTVVEKCAAHIYTPQQLVTLLLIVMNFR